MENDRNHAAEIAELRETTEAELKRLREKINGLKINTCVSGSTGSLYHKEDNTARSHTFKFGVVFTETPKIMYSASGLWNDHGKDAPSFWSAIESSSKSQFKLAFNVRNNNEGKANTAIMFSYIACGPVKRA